MRQIWVEGVPIEDAILAAGALDSDLDPTATSNEGEILLDTQPGWTVGNENTTWFQNGTFTENQPAPAGILGSLDPDCLPGAVAFQNGSGINPICLTSLNAPYPGGTWMVEVDASTTGVPGATVTAVLGTLGSSPGILVAAGELLLDLTSPVVVNSRVVPVGGRAVHSLAVPHTTVLVGLTLRIQGIVRDKEILQLCNAEDVVVGCGP